MSRRLRGQRCSPKCGQKGNDGGMVGALGELLEGWAGQRLLCASRRPCPLLPAPQTRHEILRVCTHFRQRGPHIFPCTTGWVPQRDPLHFCLSRRVEGQCPVPQEAVGHPFLCGQGTFREAPEAACVGDCQPCEPGTFCSRVGLVQPQGLCLPGHHCGPGSNTSTPVSAGTWASSRRARPKHQALSPEPRWGHEQSPGWEVMGPCRGCC